jgi:hypothetical protein
MVSCAAGWSFFFGTAGQKTVLNDIAEPTHRPQQHAQQPLYTASVTQ